MLSDRLTLAAADGLIDAPVLVIGARAGDDLSPLPAPLCVETRMRPDFEALEGAGWQVTDNATGSFATVIAVLPREKALARARIAAAAERLAPGGRLIVDGQKTDGIDSLIKALRREGAELGEPIIKAHGKSVPVLSTPDLSHWRAEPQQVDGFWTAPGVFSADGIDPASALLAGALPEKLSGKVCDLGAGWGYLSAQMLAREAVTECHLVEADADALAAARRNIDDPRARFHWADATRFGHGAGFDHIVTNPPFHRGRDGDPGLGRQFIAAAAGALAPRGRLWLVANRHLPYESALRDLFAQVEELPGSAAFKLFAAARPKRRR